MAKVDHVDEADHLLVTAAVAKAEAQTSGEIVTIVADLSDHYEDIGMAWASAATLIALFCLTVFPDFYLGLIDRLAGGWDHEYTAGEYLAILLTMLGLIWFGTWLGMKYMPLRLALTPKHIRMARVRARAITMFKVGTEAKTVGRTGVLLYLSMKEHRAEIVADDEIANLVSPEIWGDAMIALLDHVKAGHPGEGMAAAVQQMGIVLTQHFPKGSENPNELPDRLIEL